MPVYEYRATDSCGPQEGTLEARDVREAVRLLQEQGMTVLRVAELRAIPDNLAQRISDRIQSIGPRSKRGCVINERMTWQEHLEELGYLLVLAGGALAVAVASALEA